MSTTNSDKPITVRILAVDDDPIALALARSAAIDAGPVEVEAASSAAEAFAALERRDFDLLLLDLRLPDRSGAAFLSDILFVSKDALAVVVTADYEPETIVACMKRGAFQYLTKPFTPSKLQSIVHQVRSVIDLRRKIKEIENGDSESIRDPAFARIITRSPAMFGVFKSIARVSRSPLAVLVTGESGVGKELVAYAVHQLSQRSGAFVPVNVAGLDDALFADTLFGHHKGAYTGAEGKRAGLVRAADGGTLFLDEVGDIGPEAQVKLLRFLQDGEFYPIGSDKPEHSSARLVLATNADLLAKTRAGRFRSDLYYRLMIHNVSIPPLRERREDIPLLVEKFARDAAASIGRPVPRNMDRFISAIENWGFPGNVRELSGLVYGAMSATEGGALPASYAIHHINLMRKKLEPAGDSCSGSGADYVFDDGRFPTLDELEMRHIREALRRSGDNQTEAARLLGISQSTISRRLSELAREKAGAAS